MSASRNFILSLSIQSQSDHHEHKKDRRHPLALSDCFCESFKAVAGQRRLRACGDRRRPGLLFGCARSKKCLIDFGVHSGHGLETAIGRVPGNTNRKPTRRSLGSIQRGAA